MVVASGENSGEAAFFAHGGAPGPVQERRLFEGRRPGRRVTRIARIYVDIPTGG